MPELQDVLFDAEKNNVDKILVEDYLNIEEEYAALGFSDGNNVSIPGVIKFVRESQSHKGVAMIGQVLPIDGFQDVIEQFSRFIRQIGLVGLFDIDFFKCHEKFYFGELNVRIGGSGYAYTAMGVNLPEILVKSLLGCSIDDMPITRGSASFVNERMCLDDWYRGFCTTKEYYRIIKDSDISFVDDKEDSKPQIVFVKLFYQLFLKRCIKKCIGKKL